MSNLKPITQFLTHLLKWGIHVTGMKSTFILIKSLPWKPTTRSPLWLVFKKIGQNCNAVTFKWRLFSYFEINFYKWGIRHEGYFHSQNFVTMERDNMAAIFVGFQENWANFIVFTIKTLITLSVLKRSLQMRFPRDGNKFYFYSQNVVIMETDNAAATFSLF